MKYRVVHTTRYSYSEPASLSQNELFLFPRETATQWVISNSLSIQPKPQYQRRQTDYFGNNVSVFMVQHPHTALEMTSTSTVETAHPQVLEASLTPSWEEVKHILTIHQNQDELDAYQFVFSSPLIETNNEALYYAQTSFAQGVPILMGASDLIKRIYTEFSYDKNASNVDTSVSQVFKTRKGVCQDFAHLAISCLRSLGLAARYVSGYLETQPPAGKQKLVGADASHAWISIFIPGFGWVDLDPTNNQPTGESYITVAWGRDYGDVAPVKGVVMGGGSHQLSVMVDVSPAN